MGIFRSLMGTVFLEITGGDTAATLGAICEKGIPVYDGAAVDEICMTFRVNRNDYRKVRDICRKRGDSLKILHRRGLYWVIKSLFRRPVLTSGMVLFLFLMLYLPGRVYFVRVEGNVAVPTNRILEAAEGSGICFGASRRLVRSERVKNSLLEAVPELQWAGVNTAGCVATISVRERSVQAETPEQPSFSHIVADRAGIILSCTATRGNLLCAPGQAVKPGQVLISGYTDCGLVLRSTGADGEIFAQTIRPVRTVIPSECLKKGEEEEIKRSVSLIIGKKRINLWKDSGICLSTCGRIYQENYVTLPGGFRLPLGLAVDTVISTALTPWEAELTQPELTQMGDRYLTQQMIAGQILRRNGTVFQEPGRYRLEGEYVCTEMIGRVQRESIGEYNGEDH